MTLRAAHVRYLRALRRTAVVFAIAVASVVGAHPVAFASTYDVVRLLAQSSSFMRVLRYRAPLDMVAENGAVGRNRIEYEHAAHQRDVLWLVLRGLAEKNAQPVAEAIRALEYGFEFQTNRGNFANGLNVSAQRAVGADAFFLQAYCRIQLLVGESGYGGQFASRFAAMNAKLPAALSWLKSNRRELYRQDRKATNRLFFDASAFGLCGKIINDRRAIAIGEEFAKYGLANQRADGSFDEHGGYDSSYQAVSLLNIASLIGNMAEWGVLLDLTNSLAKGAEWEISRIASSGEIITSGNSRTGVGKEGDKEVNYYEVALAFFYLRQFLGDTKYAAVADDIANYLIARLQ